MNFEDVQNMKLKVYYRDEEGNYFECFKDKEKEKVHDVESVKVRLMTDEKYFRRIREGELDVKRLSRPLLILISHHQVKELRTQMDDEVLKLFVWLPVAEFYHEYGFLSKEKFEEHKTFLDAS